MSKLQERFNQLISSLSEGGKKGWKFGASAKDEDMSNLTSNVVNLIIEQGILERASDIHVEPTKEIVRIRYRVDGQLYEALNVENMTNLNIIPRIKILSGLDTDSASKRKSQDGRFTSKYGANNYDFRVATFPTVEGEKVVIRILDERSGIQRLDVIGLNVDDQKRIERMLKLKSGLVLVCGPTGSGKTTTLYAMLNKINSPINNIVTLEDPVEYKIKGMNQCDIKSRLDFSFADGLKAVLRQDPDIILVGEIRDKETAEIATRAAITGHLVFSSVHANSAIGTVMRLINMGLDQALVSYSMIGAISQRLVRRICDECKVPFSVNYDQLLKLKEIYGINIDLLRDSGLSSSGGIQYGDEGVDKSKEDDVILYKGQGCINCNQTGYKGRASIFEIVYFNQEFRDAILRKASSMELQEIAIKSGTKLLAMDGLEKARQGITSLDEIYPLLIEN